MEDIIIQIHRSISGNDLDTVKRLVLANPEVLSVLDTRASTILTRAVGYNQPEITQWLIDQGASILVDDPHNIMVGPNPELEEILNTAILRQRSISAI